MPRVIEVIIANGGRPLRGRDRREPSVCLNNPSHIQTNVCLNQTNRVCLSAQKRNSELADHLSENLQFYDFLDPASRKLNAPNAGSTVRNKEFSDMLRRLDQCLDYMETHVRGFAGCNVENRRLLTSIA